MGKVNTIVKLLCEFVIFIGTIRFYWYNNEAREKDKETDSQTTILGHSAIKWKRKRRQTVGFATAKPQRNIPIPGRHQKYQYHRSKLDTFVAVGSMAGKLKYFKF